MAKRSAVTLPKYDNPPLVEVVCGVQFVPLANFQTAHIGLLWNECFRSEYPSTKEHPPIAKLIEAPDQSIQAEFTFNELPDWPRIWFLNKDESSVIQLQRDRFLFNWRKMRRTDQYPSFKKIWPRFRERLNDFEGFLGKNNLEPLKLQQFELTYVNHIRLGEGWSNESEVVSVLPDLAWRMNNRFLPVPSNFNWQVTFPSTDDKSLLRCTARRLTLVKENNLPVIQLEFTARNKPGTMADAMEKWFDFAHGWIVNAFADITGPSIQKGTWRRTV